MINVDISTALNVSLKLENAFYPCNERLIVAKAFSLLLSEIFTDSMEN